MLTAGILGYGERGKTLAKIAKGIPEINIVGVADPVDQRRFEARSDGLIPYFSAEVLFEKVCPQVVKKRSPRYRSMGQEVRPNGSGPSTRRLPSSLFFLMSMFPLGFSISVIAVILSEAKDLDSSAFGLRMTCFGISG